MKEYGLILLAVWLLIGVAILDSCNDYIDSDRITIIEKQLNIGGETK